MNDPGSQELPILTARELKKELEEAGSKWPVDAIVTDRAVLAQVSRPTTWAEVQELGLIPRLMQLLNRGWCPSVGYAAIQIGVPVRMALYVPARIDYGKSKEPVVLVNPEIVSKKYIVPFHKEGCMSIPNQRQATWRYNEVTYTIEKPDGKRSEPITVQGFTAAVIQHEVDHMDGILNLQRVTKPAQPGVNDRCGCGSGKKFKRCCARKVE